ncbi:histidine phosphatase family protein [Lactobacillus sp. S2-2]|uniref:histidine phosphatase family protein n=1 Tax=Lactobacillus sp. S2-2 TaxID=2692917 RepID=UPI001F24217A|nr:histidine phosphatase family protein [Lactobacillus sp. S2-2]MCF6515890.1 histidine phosphatase family protein [Lactobacillus sp. S2-2]
MTNFYFIRHGQTSANAQGLKQGQINTEVTNLNEIGQKQAQNLFNHFDISFADRIICSPLNRTTDTANIINQNAQLPLDFDERILEISYGNWDGQSNQKLQNDHPEVFDNIINDVLPSYQKIAGGETFLDVMNRVKNFMEDTEQKYPNDNIIVVTHGFTIKAATLVAASITDDKQMMFIEEPENTSVTKIKLEQSHYYCEYYNRTANDNF